MCHKWAPEERHVHARLPLARLKAAPRVTVRPRLGRLSALAFPAVNRFCMALVYGRAERLIAKNGGFRPGQVCDEADASPSMATVELGGGVAAAGRTFCTVVGFR
jgi:hypothetical protein